MSGRQEKRSEDKHDSTQSQFAGELHESVQAALQQLETDQIVVRKDLDCSLMQSISLLPVPPALEAIARFRDGMDKGEEAGDPIRKPAAFFFKVHRAQGSQLLALHTACRSVYAACISHASHKHRDIMYLRCHMHNI